MAEGLNKVTLIGNLGDDPKIITMQNGKKMASFSLATAESWNDKNSGERKTTTEWHRITVYNEGLAGIIEKYVKKGSRLYVEGKLVTRKWVDKDGANRTTTEIVLQFNCTLLMLDGKNATSSEVSESNYQQKQTSTNNQKSSYDDASSIDEDDDFMSNDFLEDDKIPF